MRRVLMVLVLLSSGCEPDRGGFTARDEADVRELEEAYRLGWLANDSSAVMATLAADAVLMPAGMNPLVGHTVIRNFWWPADGSVTSIDAYEIHVDEVEGSGNLAYLRGRGVLEFTYHDAAGEVSEFSSNAVHLSVAKRGTEGRWRIVRRAWSAVR